MKGFLKILLIPVGLFIFPSVVFGNTDIEQQTDRVIVEITNAAGKKDVKSITWQELESMKQLKSSFSISATASTVNMIEPDYIRSIDLVNAASQELTTWATERIGIPNLTSQIPLTNNNITVAIIDSGVDYAHPLLENRMVDGYDFVDNDTDPMDEHYHGTHVAGIVAESTNENIKIMPIRALDEEGNGYDSNIAKGIYYAVDHGASVINMSFQGENYSTYLANAINYALDHDVLLVSSSGNDSSNTDNYYPASEQDIIVVSATNKYDNLASFSNTGNSIDIAAPGVEILSSIPGSKYGVASGTSMAAPFVSGIVAMLKKDHPTSTTDELELILKTHVDDRGTLYWDPLFGEGIVNVSSYTHVNLIQQALSATSYVSLPSYENVRLDKEWMINFDRSIVDKSTVEVNIYAINQEIPVQVSFNSNPKQLMVKGLDLYKPNSNYLLEIKVKNGKRYLMEFKTES
ncbi:S8 family peptidase [Psychrobacillus sp. NPDC096623]|uniref:S8 family peptidase n=1 Tax=Psychrobacillus sp. NPDC096623 TaxID=3364492 RepID=UPI00382090DC